MLKGYFLIDFNIVKLGSKFCVGRIIFMFFLVIVLFILFFLFYFVLVIVCYIDLGFYIRLIFGGKVVYNVFFCFYLLNFVVNLLVYCFVSKEFRLCCKDVIYLLVCCFCD